jgi:hypothetical protein
MEVMVQWGGVVRRQGRRLDRGWLTNDGRGRRG